MAADNRPSPSGPPATPPEAPPAAPAAAPSTGPRPVYVRERVEVPSSPRALLRAICREDHAAPEAGRRVGKLAKMAGAPARVVDGFNAAEDAAVLGGGEDGRAYQLWTDAAEAALAFLRGSDGPGEERDIAAALDRAAAAAERCGRCGRWWGLEADTGETTARLVTDRCNTRACLGCTRARLRKVVDRWAPLFAAAPLDGYRTSFVTVGSLGVVENRADVYGYLRRVGLLLRGMRDGVPRFALPPRSWVAGLRALELMPRADGGWSHVHLVVIRAAFYPYGRHLLPSEKERRPSLHRVGCPVVEEGLRGKWSLGDDRWNAWPCDGCGVDPSPADLGARGFMRSLGIGEAFRDDRVTVGKNADGTGGIAPYMAKIERYVSKVCDGSADPSTGPSGEEVAAGLTWAGRRDIQAAMRGARLLQPFGDALGLLAGPDETRLYEHGARIRVVGRDAQLYDPARPETAGVLGVWRDYAGCLPEDIPAARRPDDRRVERVTRYRADTLDTWAGWCDVAALRRGLLAGPRPAGEGVKRHPARVAPIGDVAPDGRGIGREDRTVTHGA